MSRLNLVFIFLTLACPFKQALALAPAAPTEGSIKFTRASVTGLPNTQESYHITWRDNATDEEGYEIQMRAGSTGSFNTMARYGSNTDQTRLLEAIISRSALPINTQVQFRILAWKMNNAIIESSFLTIPFTVPDSGGRSAFVPPSSVTATLDNDSDGKINLTWMDNSDGESFFQVLLQEGTTPNFTYSHVCFVPFGTTSLELTNLIRLSFSNSEFARPLLVPGKTYSAVIRATKTNVLAQLTNATVTNFNISPAFTIPTLRGPTNLSGTVTDESTVQLRWDDNSSNETGYEIQYRIITGGTPPAFAAFTETDENATSATLSIGQLSTVEFQVCAVSRYRPSGDSTDTVIRSPITPTTVQLSTTEFIPPAGVVASTSGISNTIDLVWQDKSTAEAGFDVFCRPTGTSGDYSRCVSVPNDVTKVSVKSFTTENDALGVPIFTDLTVGTPYDFIVRAVGANESVSSANSNVSSATPQHGFTSRMYQPIRQGVAFNHTVTTSNAEQRTSITATGLPTGLEMDPVTGVISGTPSQAGTFPVTLTATFSPGPPAVSTLMLRAQATPSAPTVGATIPNLTIGIKDPYIISLADKFIDTDSEIAVRWETPKGNIDFLLYPSLAPLAVANFMAYVNARDYSDVFFHRHVSDFVLQAGGFAAKNNALTTVEGRPSPLNEPGLSNLPWTIAAAKLGARSTRAFDAARTAYQNANSGLPLSDEAIGYVGNPDSATTDIFINLNDNATNLDNQNGGFTSYGRVSEGTRATVTTIRGLPVGNYGGALSSLPVDAASAPPSPTFAQLVKINQAFQIPTLSYSIDNLAASIATVTLENNQLKLTGLASGTRSVTVTAKDLDNKTVTQTFTITVDTSYQAPTITKQPVSQTITASGNTTVNFSVEASGSNLSYQWRKNEVPINTETFSTLTLTNVTAASAGSYDVIVSNANTTITSSKASLTLLSPITITKQPIAQTVVAGSTVTLSVSATGSTLSYKWRKNDVEILPPQTGSKLVLPNIQESTTGNYDVVISNAASIATNTSVTSAKALVNLRRPAELSGTLTSRFVEVGSPIEIEAAITGAPTPVCVWRRGTTIIKGQTGRKLLIPAAQLTDGGTYSVSASNIAGATARGSGGTASVIVIDKQTRLQVAKPGTTVKLMAPITGPGLTYTWSKDATVIDENTPRYSGTRNATLVITAADRSIDSGNYTCAIESATLSQTAVTGIIRFVVADAPVLLPMTGTNAAPNAFAGIAYVGYNIPHDVAVTKTPASYSITGLPKGLIYDPITGRINGIPETVGLFNIKATATNPSGSSSSMTGTIRVLPLIEGSSGSFVAAVTPSQALNFNHGGRLSLTVSDTSAFSASLQMGAENFKSAGVLRYAGTDNTSGFPVYRSILSFPRLKRSTLTLDLLIRSVSGDVSGTISDGTATANVSGYRLVWSYQFNPGPVTGSALFVDQPPTSKFTYRLNMALDPEVGRLETPQGSGFAALTVDNSGVATLVGRLADDTAITASTFISSNSLMSWFQMLNANKASFGGNLSLGTLRYSNSFSTSTKPERVIGSPRWYKEAQPISEKRYQAGFQPTFLTAAGSPYVAPGTNQTVWGIADAPNNLKIDFTSGGLTSALSTMARLNFDNSITTPPAPGNPNKVSLKVTPSTGSYTGTYEIMTGTVLRKVTFNGLILSALKDQSRFGLNHLPPRGAGFFLLPGLTPSVTTAPILSGKAELSTPWTVSFSVHPQSRSASPNSSVILSASASVSSDSGMNIKYQWRKDNVDLSDGNGFTGANTASLTISNIISSYVGSYTCVATATVGAASSGPLQAISNAALLTVSP
jgi:cyclophilin family peptidyl-prolyl cis-trans isomerase